MRHFFGSQLVACYFLNVDSAGMDISSFINGNLVPAFTGCLYNDGLLVAAGDFYPLLVLAAEFVLQVIMPALAGQRSPYLAFFA